MDKKCILCDNISDTYYKVFVHKWREYGGYSNLEYPRYLCSKKCVNNYEKNNRCNFCHIVKYEYRYYKKGNDGFTYCNDLDEITVGNTTCYNQVFNK